MKLNLDFQVQELDGETGKNDKLARFLAQALAGAILKDPDKIVRYFDWARELTKSGEIDITRADQEELKTFVVNLDGMPTIIKGQLINALQNVTTENKKGR